MLRLNVTPWILCAGFLAAVAAAQTSEPIATKVAAPDTPQDSYTQPIRNAYGAPQCTHVAAQRACDDDPICLNDNGHVRVTFRVSNAPANARATSVHYDLAVRGQSECFFGDECGCDTDESDNLFCQDMRIVLTNAATPAGNGSALWNHQGQQTDRGQDDDLADDQDIELHRTTQFFTEHVVNQDWYLDLYDEIPIDEGQLDCVQLYICHDAPATIHAVVRDAWWTGQHDDDNDLCFEETALLHWDTDVSDGASTLTVFERILYRVCGEDRWFELRELQPHTVIGNNVDDFVASVPLTGECDCFDYLIEVYEFTGIQPDDTLDPTEDLDLAGHLEETAPDMCTPPDCNDDNECTNDTCINGECLHAALHEVACGDPSESACDHPDICLSGMCDPNYARGGSACETDGNECTEDRCDTKGVCLHLVQPDCSPRCIIAKSHPAHCIIDARQPHPIDNPKALIGWDRILLTFEEGCSTSLLIAESFKVTVVPPGPPTPTIRTVQYIPDGVIVIFEQPIPPHAWICLQPVAGGRKTCFAALPADVSGDGVSSALDIIRLIDCLNGVAMCELYQTDANGSGTATAQDILRVVDLLNGAGTFSPWLAATLPDCPPQE